MEEAFLREEMLLGARAMERLRRAHVIVFGIGGVGSYAAEGLARAGIGRLTLVDNDTVGMTNLNRQLCALHSTLGQYKVDVATVKTSIPESALKEDLAVSKAMDLVKENAVVTEE